MYTWDGTTNSLSIDGGTPGASTTAHQTATPTSAYLATYDGGSEPYDGSIDEVRVYNAVLTTAQIARLYAGRYAGTGGIATDTLGANTTVTGQLSSTTAILDSSTRTMNRTLTTAATAINSGTYTWAAPPDLRRRPDGERRRDARSADGRRRRRDRDQQDADRRREARRLQRRGDDRRFVGHLCVHDWLDRGRAADAGHHRAGGPRTPTPTGCASTRTAAR